MYCSAYTANNTERHTRGHTGALGTWAHSLLTTRFSIGDFINIYLRRVYVCAYVFLFSSLSLLLSCARDFITFMLVLAVRLYRV